MNEYRVTVVENGVQHERLVFAPTAAAARDLVEADSDGEVTAVRFLRAAGVSCTIRDGRGRH